MEFGHTKVFIRSPQTLTALERRRAEAIPSIVLILQKVGVSGGVVTVYA